MGATTGRHRSETETSIKYPMPKRLREKTTPSPAPKSVKLKAAQPIAEVSLPLGNGWKNFYEFICQDDKDMVAQSHQNRQSFGGDAYRPEIRETYKDQEGKTETAAHTKIEVFPGVQQDDGLEDDDDDDKGGVVIKTEKA